MMEAIDLILNSCEWLYHRENDPDKANELAFCISEAEVLKKMIETSVCLEFTEDERKAISTVKHFSLTDVFWSEKTLKTIDGILRKLPVKKHEETM